MPPVFSGYRSDDRRGWSEFRAEYERTHRELWADFDEFVRSAGAPGLPDGPLGPSFMPSSPYLNLWLYPEEADYARRTPLDASWHRLGSCVRAIDEAWRLPACLADRTGPLVYLSLGSLGSADVGLMQRLIDVLAETRYRVIVSTGPQHDQLRLAPNMTGAEFLPQPAVLSQVDLVITHGGNNTMTECLHHGRPMIVLPLFWDQYDNAQRIDELGLGVRLDTYRFEPAQLTGAVDRLLADRGLAERLASIARRLQIAPGRLKAADLIERVAERPGSTAAAR